MIRTIALTDTLLAPVAAFAQELPTAPYLPLDYGDQAAQAAVDACSAEGHNVSVAIVARSGETKVLFCVPTTQARTLLGPAPARPSPPPAWAVTRRACGLYRRKSRKRRAARYGQPSGDPGWRSADPHRWRIGRWHRCRWRAIWCN